MPTFRHGKNTRVFVDAFDLSNMLREYTFTGEADVAETSAFGTFDKTFVVGLIGSQANLSGMFSGGAGETDAVFNALVGDDNDHVNTILPEGIGAAGSGIGLKAIMIPGRFNGRTINGSISDMVGAAATIQGSGVTRMGHTLHDYVTAETATGNSTSIDNGAATAFGGAGHLHVPVNSRNGTGIFKVQHSTDNAAWSDLITFTTVPSTTTASERVVVAGTVNRYTRGQWTIAGAAGSITFAIAFARFPF